MASSRVDKRFKLFVKSKQNLPSEGIKNALKSSVNPKENRVGIKSFKSMKDGRVLIETGTQEEINLLSSAIKEKCGEDMEVTIPKLRKPRMIIRNVPQDISVENLEGIILDQNPELDMAMGEIDARFKFRTKRGQVNMVIEMGSETRKKLVNKKLKIGWLICNVDDYLIAKRCFRCSRFNHRHQECRGGDLPSMRRRTQAQRL